MELPNAVRQYIKAHDGLLLANHGALTVGADVFAAYYKMETIEHFAKISLTARLLGGERLISQEEVLRLQSLRGLYGIASPAPICLDDDVAGGAGPGVDATCQVVRSPDAPGTRLVPDPASGVAFASRDRVPGGDEEIRLTYRELAALIEDAVQKLR
jgi:L-fuculose-phosphate aldolase